MGFSDEFLRRVILEQAALLALAGFVLGLCFAFVADAAHDMDDRVAGRDRHLGRACSSGF